MEINIKKKAFTLIELLVVISIISLLSSVVFASVGSARVKARDLKRKTDIDAIVKALYLYYDKTGTRPTMSYAGNCGTKITGTDALSVALTSGGFISSIPTIPSLSGDDVNCGDGYYAGNFDPGKTAVLTLLENADVNCVSTFSWWAAGSYCNKKYIKIMSE